MNTGNLAFRSQIGRETVKTIGRSITGQQKAGGLAALYLALAYLLAMPFFLLVVDYHSAVGPAAKVASLVTNHGAMQVMYLIAYVVLGIALSILALALYERLKPAAPALMQTATAVGLIWAVLLVASGLVFNAGMGAVVTLYPSNPAQAASMWQAIEPVSDGLSLRRWRDPRRPVGPAGEHRGPSGGWVLSGLRLVRRDGRRNRARLDDPAAHGGGDPLRTRPDRLVRVAGVQHAAPEPRG
jgi:hypothetical protein